MPSRELFYLVCSTLPTGYCCLYWSRLGLAEPALASHRVNSNGGVRVGNRIPYPIYAFESWAPEYGLYLCAIYLNTERVEGCHRVNAWAVGTC